MYIGSDDNEQFWGWQGWWHAIWTRKTLITHQLWHCQQDGSTNSIGDLKTLPSMGMEGAWKPWQSWVRSTMACDADHDYQPPWPNVLDASKAVCKALGVPQRVWFLIILTLKLKGHVNSQCFGCQNKRNITVIFSFLPLPIIFSPSK